MRKIRISTYGKWTLEKFIPDEGVATYQVKHDNGWKMAHVEKDEDFKCIYEGYQNVPLPVKKRFEKLIF